jgi:lipid-binding SYLF domain-containing protein
MTKTRLSLAVGLLAITVDVSRLWAGSHEMATLELAADALHELSSIPSRHIPPAIIAEAKALVVVPHVIKAGLVVDHRSGRGVVLVRRPDGKWSDPIFVDLEGNGIGLEAGVESTDLVLVVRTQSSLERLLRGRVTLGADASVAAGPIGHDAETDKDRWGKAEVFSYSRGRGLFVGVALEGTRITIDGRANEVFYARRGYRPDDILARRMPGTVPAIESLKVEAENLTMMPLRPH